MKKYFFIAFAMCLTGMVTSCGDKNSVSLKVESELRDLGEYMSPAEEEVILQVSDLKEDGKEYKVLTSSLVFTVSKSVASDYNYDLEVELLDKNHVKICDLPDFEIDYTDDDDNGELDNIVHSGTVRAQMKRRVDIRDWEDEDATMWDKIRTSGAFVVIKPSSSYAKYAEYKGSSNKSEASSDDEDETVNSESEDWDAVLDEYENYVDKYIALLKKAKQGDMSALSEYAGMMEKAQELGGKMDDAQGEMSSAQWSRYTRILQKMTNAAQSM